MSNDNNQFNFTYSAPTESERLEIESIRRQYKEELHEETSAQKLRRLHSFVVNSATCVSLIFGVIGILVFGLGMTCVLEWNNAMLGVILGAVGAILAALAHPAYRFVLNRNKKKYGEEILRLSAELLGESEES